MKHLKIPIRQREKGTMKYYFKKMKCNVKKIEKYLKSVAV